MFISDCVYISDEDRALLEQLVKAYNLTVTYDAARQGHYISKDNDEICQGIR